MALSRIVLDPSDARQCPTTRRALTPSRILQLSPQPAGGYAWADLPPCPLDLVLALCDDGGGRNGGRGGTGDSGSNSEGGRGGAALRDVEGDRGGAILDRLEMDWRSSI